MVTPVCLFIFCADIHADRRGRIRVFSAASAAGRMDSSCRPEGAAKENRRNRMILLNVPDGHAVCRETYDKRT